MKLIASMNTRNELGRYLRLTVPALLEWCDEVRVQDDGSDDGTFEYLAELDRVEVVRNTGPRWVENEGELHQQLLDFTIAGRPTHVLAIDADEYVADGPAVRAALESAPPGEIAFTLRMVELWSLRPPLVRCDGGWRPHPVGILYRVPPALLDGRAGVEWRIWGRKLAGGRVPRAVRSCQRRRRTVELDVDICHLGWANPAERERRHRRYVELDGGQYHAGSHLDSIRWPDERCDLRPYPAENLPAALR